VEKAVIENKHGQGMGAKKASQLSTGKRKETREELLAVRRVCKKLQISAVVAVAVAARPLPRPVPFRTHGNGGAG